MQRDNRDSLNGRLKQPIELIGHAKGNENHFIRTSSKDDSLVFSIE